MGRCGGKIIRSRTAACGTACKVDGIPITYAGGIGSLEDLEAFRCAGKEKLNFTIGSALDLFGGQIPYENVKNVTICERVCEQFINLLNCNVYSDKWRLE